MRPKPFPSTLRLLGPALATLLAGIHSASAVTIFKANNQNALNLPSSWSGGIVPGSGNIAVWNAAVTGANTTTLGADLAWRGISITNPGGLVTIGAGYTLTLGSGGIDMSLATRDLTLSADLALATGGQTWTVPAGRTLTLNGSFSRVSGATLTIDRTLGAGTVAANLPLVNGIVGPWASVKSDGFFPGNGSEEGFTYATVSGGVIVPYTSAVPMTGTGSWGGIPSGGDGTINYDITGGGTFGVTGLVRNVNTIRYVGFGATQASNINPVGNVLTLNGFMNAGSGTFFIGGTGGANNYGLNVTIGTSNSLVLDAATADITLRSGILNGGSPGNVTIKGENTVSILGNTSNYTGATTVAGGTLLVGGSGTINTTSGIEIRGANARFVHASSVASTVPVTLTRGTLDGTGGLGAVTVANDPQNVLTHGNGGTGSLTLGSLTFGGAATVRAIPAAGTTPITVTGDLATAPANGPIVLQVSTGPLVNGLYNLISYGSFGGASSDFTANVASGLNSRQSASIVLNENNVALQVSGDFPKWTGALSGVWSTATLPNPKNWRLVAGGTATDFIEGDNVLFDDTATGTTTVNISSGPINAGVIEFNNNTKNYRVTSSSFWGIDEGTIIKNGTGNLSLETFNTHSGGTVFNGGGLFLNDSFVLGDGPLTIGAGQPKTLDNTSGFELQISTPVPQNWNDDFTFAGTGSLDLGSGTVTIGGAGSERAVTVNGNVLTVGEIKAAAHGLTKLGSGKLVLTSTGAGAAASTVSGLLSVAGGTLQMNRDDASATDSGDLTASGLAGSGTIVNGAAVDRWLFINTPGSHTFPGTLANGGAGGLGFNKQGTGSVTLTGALSYTGQTTVEGGLLVLQAPNSGPGTNAVINAGTLALSHPAALGGTSTIRLAGNAVAALDIAVDGGLSPYGIVFGTTTNSTIRSNRATTGAGVNHTLTTVGTNGLGGGTLTIESGENVSSGAGRITFTEFGLSAGTVQTTTLNPTTGNVTLGNVSKVANNFSQTLDLGGTSEDNHVTGVISNGVLTDANVLSVTKSNSSTWTLSNTNTYTGNTLIGTANGAGVLRATADGALGTGTVIFDASGGNPGPTSRLELSGGITLTNAVTLSQRNNTSDLIRNSGGNNVLGGTLSLAAGGAQATVSSEAGKLTLAGPVNVGTASPRHLRLGGAAEGEVTGSLTDNPANPAGVFNLTKVGSGTWTLSGVNTHTGTVTVSEGTLAITGDSPSATGTITVGNGATLAGNGNLGGSVIVSDGGRQSLAVAATPAAQKTRQIAGTLDLSAAGDILRIVAASAPAEGNYTLATASGGITGHTGGTLNDTVLEFSGVNGTVSVQGNSLVLTVGEGGGVSTFDSWATSFGLNPNGNGAPGFDADADGFDNGTEFILGGSPVRGSNNPKIHSFIADSDADGDMEKELILTIAVPQGTTAFSAGSPQSTATFDGYTITVRGSTDLVNFNVGVTPVGPVTTGLPPAPNQGGVQYVYRSFSLNGSNGTSTKGFLQVVVTHP